MPGGPEFLRQLLSRLGGKQYGDGDELMSDLIKRLLAKAGGNGDGAPAAGTGKFLVTTYRPGNRRERRGPIVSSSGTSLSATTWPAGNSPETALPACRRICCASRPRMRRRSASRTGTRCRLESASGAVDPARDRQSGYPTGRPGVFPLPGTPRHACAFPGVGQGDRGIGSEGMKSGDRRWVKA